MLVHRFAEQVRKNPDKIAVQDQKTQLTFAELNQSANRVADAILNKCETLDIKTVALLFEHSKEMIVAMLGVLKTGFIYVPLDPSYPEKRLSYMVEHSKAGVIVTNNFNFDFAKRIVEQIDREIEILNIDLLDKEILVEDLDTPIFEDEVAYILYTSGSTGKPKGVMQSHKNIWHFVKNYAQELSITDRDRLTLFSAFSHDAAVIDIYTGLLTGATLYPINIKDQVKMMDIADWLQKEKITIWHSVPTVFRYFMNTLSGEEDFQDLRLIVLGGERVLEHDVLRFQELFNDTTLVNLYGQSESSFNSAQFIEADSPFTQITLGDVIEDTELIVITDSGEEALPFEIGEIVVASEHVAVGYFNDSEKTQEVFKYSSAIGKLYKTGDLGKLNIDDTIEYVGRKDFQLKVRGYRIEPGEIESHLLNHQAILECVVIAKNNQLHAHEDNLFLCAFVVQKEEVSEIELRSYLAQFVPDYMIPDYFISLDKMPLTPNNKTDRKALLEIEIVTKSLTEIDLPANETEEKLVAIWSDLLGRNKIGVNDNFFMIGGHSLKATQLAQRIFKTLEVEILQCAADSDRIRLGPSHPVDVSRAPG